MKKKPSSRGKAKGKQSPAVEPPNGLTAEQIMAAVDARWNEVQSRLERRQADVRRKPASFEVPPPVMDFLEELYREPSVVPPDGTDWRRDLARMATIWRSMRDAYLQGCAQGYIEGVVARMEPDRRRSATANAGKRVAFVKVGKATMTRDERDALMAAEYSQLVTMMKPTPAYQRLAGKYEFESWQGVAAAIKAFRKRQSQQPPHGS